jgi:hypothetical protein
MGNITYITAGFPLGIKNQAPKLKAEIVEIKKVFLNRCDFSGICYDISIFSVCNISHCF